MRSPFSKPWILTVALLLITLAPSHAEASVIGVGVGAFGSGSTLTTFTGLADGLPVHGLIVDGIQFTYSLGSGHLIIDGGPGVTNNISPPNIVSVGNNTGILNIVFPSLLDTFGYGYAILNAAPGTIANATTITLFNGATNVGSLAYASALDPAFQGGFAGIQSTLAFNRAEVVFNPAVAPAFALDSIRTHSVVAPEPSALVLLGTGLGLLWSCRRMIRTRSR